MIVVCRVVRRSMFMILCVLLTSLLFCSVSTAKGSKGDEQRLMCIEADNTQAHSSREAWQQVLQFDKPAIYEYGLTRVVDGRLATGRLTVQIIQRHADLALALTYEVDGQQDGFYARTMTASPSEALLAALLTSQLWSLEDIRLLWTPFIFTRWVQELSEMSWRSGEGWTIRSAGTESFRVDRSLCDHNGRTIYRCHLERHGRTILEMDVNLDLPLPQYVSWVDAAGACYEAEMTPQQQSPVAPRM